MQKNNVAATVALDDGSQMTPSILPFFLPRISPGDLDDCCDNPNPDKSLSHACAFHKLSLQLLAWAIQNNADPNTVELYLKSFDLSEVQQVLRTQMTFHPEKDYFPILYFAVERNSPEMIRSLCNSGAQASTRVRTVCARPRLPLLPYAVLSAEYGLSDTTDAVIALLAMGANPGDVREDMWMDYLKAPRKGGHEQKGLINTKDSWCTYDVREALCRNLNLMHRYVLWKANGTGQQTVMKKEIARSHKLTPLFEVVYHIIGQNSATQQTIDCIMDYFLFGDKAPMVLLSSGPSGHGKTNLARRMGKLLSLEMHAADCTEMMHETDMFGPKKPYYRWESGAPLNNFLWDKAGQRCVVFLDELEKTTEEVRNAMLKLFESGIHKDRRSDKPVDCSKIIWVLAPNLGCEIIQKFWAKHLVDQTEEEQQKVPRSGFERSLKQSIITNLGAPFTGCLTAIVPFMPFSTDEQAVAAYKFMRDLRNNVRKHIDTSSRCFPRHMFVDYNGDGAIASHIARDSYSPETGARPLQHAVNRDIRGKLSRVFLNGKEIVKDEMNAQPLQNYEVRLILVGEGFDEIRVEMRGTKQLQSFTEE